MCFPARLCGRGTSVAFLDQTRIIVDYFPEGIADNMTNLRLTARRFKSPAVPACLACLLLNFALWSGDVRAALDIRNAETLTLENGLTVVLLEDRNFPVVSVQTLYRVGARNETIGKTGLAHFLEHMAFRDSENFPGTGLVSSIYAVGGEWHGYTWLDQTTYYSTVPKDDLDLLLRIEADRMMRLELPIDDMDAERGAVLAEMHMYENSPASMLIDAVMFASFLAHPYRNNTIGWEADIENLEHDDVVNFYRQHYHPANAVLAIVGDFDSRDVVLRIRELFGSFPARVATPSPHTSEPIQAGEREVRLYAASSAREFRIGYRAPSVHDEQFAAFLVLQEMLGTGSGVNFLQNDWGTAVADGDLLSGAVPDLTTWFPPSEQPFLFVIGGRAPDGVSEDAVMQAVEARVAMLRRKPPTDDALAAAIDDVLEDLDFDIRTTEDAAHQLAFYAGMGATNVLRTLPGRVQGVSAADVHRAALTYLLPQRRTIAWHLPRAQPADPQVPAVTGVDPASFDAGAAHPVDHDPVPAPVVHRLGGGVPVLVQYSDLSATVTVDAVLPGRSITGAPAMPDTPVFGYSTLSYRGSSDQLPLLVSRLAREVNAARRAPAPAAADSSDPYTHMEREFAAFMHGGTAGDTGPVAPALVVVSGNVSADRVIALLETAVGDQPPGELESPPRTGFETGELVVTLNVPLAQAQLGYIVPAPAPREPEFHAWQILRYILAHDYEGRFGKAAISDRGLAYYVDSRFRSNGVDGWITLSVGVDPGKLQALEKLLADELQGLRSNPPSMREIDEAKNHFIGRARSAAQSNDELSSTLATDWLWHGELVPAAALERSLADVSRDDVLRALDGFLRGTTVVVSE